MEHVDFDRWIETFQMPKIIYYIHFDQNGNVLGLYPSYTQNEADDYLEIDGETALQIQEGKVSLLSCEVEIPTKTFVIHANKRQTITDEKGPLHRIIEKKYSEDKNYDLFITHKNKKLKFELAKKYGGTKTTLEKDLKKIPWSKDTLIRFILTNYNDPHVIHKTVECRIKDLLGRSMEVDVSDCPENFSVYTRKIFSNYVIAKNENS